MSRTKQASVSEVQDFYDEFSETRMAGYLKFGNLRIKLATKFIKENISESDLKILDVGCGIGIATAELADAIPRSSVLGIDLSQKNIETAKRHQHRKNLSFEVLDITDDSFLSNAAYNSFDAITLIDVIEHIPEGERQNLFQSLHRISASDAKLLITYPSPEYQEYLYKNNREELQIIDNVIYPDQIIAEARRSGWSVSTLQYKNAWRKNMYIHALFSKSNAIDRIKEIDQMGFMSYVSLLIKRKWA